MVRATPFDRIMTGDADHFASDRLLNIPARILPYCVFSSNALYKYFHLCVGGVVVVVLVLLVVAYSSATWP